MRDLLGKLGSAGRGVSEASNHVHLKHIVNILDIIFDTYFDLIDSLLWNSLDI